MKIKKYASSFSFQQHVNDVGNTEQKEYEVLSRPVGWDEFMSQKEYGTIIDDALTYYKDILQYKY